MLKKRSIVNFIIVLFLATKSQAQHCPFDGTSIIMLKIEGDKQAISNIILQEVRHSNIDSCRFANKFLDVVFQPIDSLYAQNHWVAKREKYPKILSEKGDYYVTLNMAQVDCMIPKGNEYTYLKRHFMVSYHEVKTGKIIKVDVPNKRIYSLCTSHGEWDRIRAIKVKGR
jgi:hypothetical protein